MTLTPLELKEAPLGKTTNYVGHYSRELLYPISRDLARAKTGIDSAALPFIGCDFWNGNELSWLNPKGKPEVAFLELRFPCASPKIVESKSMKLYLNSFSQSHFEGHAEVEQIIAEDLFEATEAEVSVKVIPLDRIEEAQIGRFSGINLDRLDISTNTYTVTPEFLVCNETVDVEESLHSALLKSHCLATGQPDWGDIQIYYHGKQIDHEGLLKYIISYRNHAGFGEHCVEQIFSDIWQQCKPHKLSVYARYTKRGGLDICPFRSSFQPTTENIRHVRQ